MKKIYSKLKYLLINLFFIYLNSYSLTNVHIAVLEASYMPVYTDSERNSLIFSMPIALQHYGKQAKSCGYQYSFSFSEFAYGNPESARLSVKYILENKPWAIWGPETNDELDQSRPFLNDYDLLQFSSFTFTSAYKQKNIISLSSHEDDEMKFLVREVGKTENLGVIYDPSCNMCNIYLKSIQKNWKDNNFKYYQLNSELDIPSIHETIKNDKIKNLIVLLYGDTTGKVISSITENINFYGTKMFGNEVSSEMMKYDVSKANIFLVRPLPPEDLDDIYFNIQDQNKSHRVFDNIYYITYFIRKYTDILCKYKPKNLVEMNKYILNNLKKFKYKAKYQVLKSNGKNLYVYKNIAK